MSSSSEVGHRSCDCAQLATLHVLVTGVGGPLGRSVALELVRRGAIVHGTDVDVVDVDQVATWRVPPAADPRYLPSITRLVANLGVSLVIPTTLAELPVVAAGRAAFSATVDVVVAGAGAVATAHDRLLTSHHLATRGVAVPPFSVPSGYSGAAEAIADLGGPLMIRPRTRGTADKALLVTSAEDVDWSTLTDDLIMQRHLEGADYASMAYRPSVKGVPRQVMVLQATHPTLAAPQDHPLAQVQRSGVEDIERLTMAAVRALGLSGPVDLVIRREKGQAPVVLDVTPRLGRHFAATPQILDSILTAHRLFADNVAATSASGAGSSCH